MFAFRGNTCNEIINTLSSSIFRTYVRKNFKKTKLTAFFLVLQYLISSAAQKSFVTFSVNGFARVLDGAEITPECFYSLFQY